MNARWGPNGGEKLKQFAYENKDIHMYGSAPSQNL